MDRKREQTISECRPEYALDIVRLADIDDLDRAERTFAMGLGVGV
jgi:hypothetical protein